MSASDARRTTRKRPDRDDPWPQGLSRSAGEHDEVWVPKHEVQDAMRVLVRDLVPGSAAVFAGLFLIQATMLWWVGVPPFLVQTSVGLFLGFAAIAVGTYLSPPPLVAANALAFLLCVLAISAALFSFRWQSEPLLTIPFFLFVASSAMIFLERRWFVSFLVTASALWLSATVSGYPLRELPYYGFALVCVVALTSWFFSVRFLALRRLVYVELQAKKRKEMLLHRVDDAFKSSAELRELSVRDPLTGAYNRRYLGQLSRNLESLSGWGLMLIDLDGFKRINDERGHEVGDRVLQKMAHFIRRQARAEDHLVRFGGDEFLLLMKVEDEDELRQVAARLRTVAEREAPVSFSMGTVYRDQRESMRELLKRADEAMYADKRRADRRRRLSSGDDPQRAAGV